MNKKILILDTNAFIRSLNINALAQEYDIYTTHDVLYEIKDKRAKDKFLTIAFDIHTKFPEDKAVDYVNDFSKRTGDFTSLSGVDKDVIALGVTLAYEKKKTHLLRREPPALTEWIPRDTQNKNSDFVEVNNPYDNKPAATEQAKTTTVEETKPAEVKTENVETSKTESTEAPKTESTEAEVKNTTESNETAPETTEADSKAVTEEKVVKPLNKFDNDSDDEGGWITPANLTKHIHKGTTHNKTLDEMGIAIMTTDFAMQNVIIQMGIPLISADGYIIRQTKRWVLECGGCQQICKVMDKQFCPKCGNPTLTKLSVRANNDGTMTFFRRQNKVFNNRGKIFAIPKAKGGRSGNDMILREDEMLMNGRSKQINQAQKNQEKKLNAALTEYDNGFGFDIMKKDLKKGAGVKIGYGRMNPNDPGQMKKLNFNR